MSETELETAKRHVREGALNIEKQREHMQGLSPESHVGALARQLLCWSEDLYDSDVRHLSKLHAQG